jgi:hypothetical protein
MKKTKAVSKLEISKETLRQLNGPELGKVGGAAWSDESICPTVTSNRCG